MAAYIVPVILPSNSNLIPPPPIILRGPSGSNEKPVEEYNDEFNKFTHKRELKRKAFWHQSHQTPYRKYLVGFIRKVCRDNGYCRATLFLAIHLLDLYMDHHKILIRRLQIVAIASIVMAAKVEECSATVPKFKDLMPTPEENDKKYYSEIQKEMLDFFEWDLLIPTVAHHIYNFMKGMVTFDEQRVCNIPNLTQCMSAVIEMYLDNLINDVHLMQTASPSKLAAALIASCRLRFGLPAWNYKLKHLTKYSQHEIQNVLTSVTQGTKLFTCINCFERFSYR